MIQFRLIWYIKRK